MKALDLFCGGGGACLGMQWAGFEVIGIGIKPRPNYPGHIIQGDIHDLPLNIHDFDFVWASAPCQLFSRGIICNKTKYPEKQYPNLIPITQKILKGHPFTCIENVPGAPIHPDLILNGATVGLPFIERKRHFELSFFTWNPPLKNNCGFTFTVRKRLSAYNKQQIKEWRELGLKTSFPKEFAKAIMGIPYFTKMTIAEIGESVPPPMAKYIAEQAYQLISNERSNNMRRLPIE